MSTDAPARPTLTAAEAQYAYRGALELACALTGLPASRFSLMVEGSRGRHIMRLHPANGLPLPAVAELALDDFDDFEAPAERLADEYAADRASHGEPWTAATVRTRLEWRRKPAPAARPRLQPTTAPRELADAPDRPHGIPGRSLGMYYATGYALRGRGGFTLAPHDIEHTPLTAEQADRRAADYYGMVAREVADIERMPGYSRADALARLAAIIDDYRGGMLPPAE